MDFEAYLKDKKIDSDAFLQSEPEKWQSFKALFEKVHPSSFTVQKKFLLNDLRRLYQLKSIEPVKTAEVKENIVSVTDPETKKPARPVIKRAPVMKKPDEGVPDA